MKKHRGSLVLLLAALMLLTLCSCSEKVKPEKIDTKDFSRDILVEAPVDGLEVIHADKSSQSLQPGDKLKSDDGIRVGSGGELVLKVDEDKQLFAQEDTALRLEASGTPEKGKTRICLEEGSVLICLDKALEEGELLEVQTNASTISIPNGITRVSRITENDLSLIHI